MNKQLKIKYNKFSKRYEVETEFKTFRFNVEENAQQFIILWYAGSK